MTIVFISYRRADSRPFVERLHDHLEQKLGSNNVFQDVDNIPIGADFVQFISQYIARSHYVLVVIGPHWATSMAQRQNQEDFVRLEIETAFNLGKKVIPVLVGNASMPSSNELPQSVRRICSLNAAQVRDNPFFKDDVATLIQHILSNQSLGSSKYTNTNEQVNSVTRSEPPDLSALLGESPEWYSVKPQAVTIRHGKWVEKEQKAGLFNKNTVLSYVESRAETLNVNSFWIASYPIINCQYDVFLNSNDGYSDIRSWISIPQNPAKPLTTNRYDVRTNVNWYETSAFCRWLTMKINFGTWENYRRGGSRIWFSLPREEEWQASMAQCSSQMPHNPNWEWVDTRASNMDGEFGPDGIVNGESYVVIRGGTKGHNTTRWNFISD